MNFILAASGFSDRLYGLMIGVGMIAAIVLAYFVLKRRGYNPDIVFDIAIICIPIAIIGARLYYIFFSVLGKETSWGYWFNKDLTFLGFYRGSDNKLHFEGLGGLAVLGGIIFAAFAAVFIVRPLNRRKKNPLDQMTIIQMFDLFFIMIIMAQGIGRIGCYFAGCCYGRTTSCHVFPFAVEMGGKWVLATFFYEAFFNFAGFGIMLWLYLGKRKSYDGFNFAFYCMWYGLTRAIIEGFRGDSLRLWEGGIRVSQLLSILLLLYGIGSVAYHIYKAKKAGKKFFIFVPETLLNESYYGYEKTIIHLNKIHMEKAAKTEESEDQNKGSGFSFKE